jgi:ATP-dependent DNA helicase RecG
MIAKNKPAKTSSTPQPSQPLKDQSVVKAAQEHYDNVFAKLGLYSPIDFCCHLPFRYENQYHAYSTQQALQHKGKTVLFLKIIGSQHTPKRARWIVQDMYDEVQTKYIPPEDCFNHAQMLAQGDLPKNFDKLPIYVDFFVGGRSLNMDQSYFFYGELKYMGQYLQMVHPFTLSYRREDELTPIYSSTAGLTQYMIRQMIHEQIAKDLTAFCRQSVFMAKGVMSNMLIHVLFKRLNIQKSMTYQQALDYSNTQDLQILLNSHLPHVVLKRLIHHCGDDIIDALYFLHNLPSHLSAAEYQLIQDKIHPTYDLVKIYEYLAYQVSLLKAHQLKKQYQLTPLKDTKAFSKLQTFIDQLPWQLTEGQKHAWQEILEDLQKPIPMQRLLQGDVGSGKTVIALLASLYVSAHDQQVVIMAPTEILAQQLAKKCQQFLAPFGLKIDVLVGSTKAKAKKQIKEDLANGQIDIIVGTHALIEDDVTFKQLGLIVIDEQHRFGVRQRLKLKQKYIAHELMMSATPIPRTLAMGLYAYLNLSTIHGLPANRLAIQTKVMSTNQRLSLIQRLKHLLLEKAQIYWVCPLIEEKSDEGQNISKMQTQSNQSDQSDYLDQSNRKVSEKKTLQNAQATYELLCQELSDIDNHDIDQSGIQDPSLKIKPRIALLHGKMKAADKNQIMNQFAAGEIDILVATTVIEVGVDVPNANVMIIEDATQFGLAQLHQLRGRVGRGSRESYCLLLYQTPIGALAKERLKVMQDTQDGFIIAQKDLELRGFGELLGQKQAGEISFRLFDFIRDGVFVPFIKELAEDILEKNYPIEEFVEFWLSKNIEIIQEQP